MLSRISIFIAGVTIYVIFLLTTLYAIGFVGNLMVPKSIDDGVSSAPGTAIPVDLVLIGIFGFQHSLMARPAFNGWWTQRLPQPLERSMYVLGSSLALILLFWQWRPIPLDIWNVPTGWVSIVLSALFWLGWTGVVLSTFLIDYFDLFGLRQVYLHLRGVDYTSIPFKKPVIYNYMRHPMMLSFLIAFWATPRMTVGHLIFAVGMTVVILIGIAFEEQDLLRAYGETYSNYRKQVSMLIPLRRKK